MLNPGLSLEGTRTFGVVKLVLDFQDHLDFYAGSVGQRAHTHGGPGMGPSLTVQLAQKVGCSVGDLGLLAEIGSGVNHAQQLGHLLYLIQVSYHGSYISQTV